MMRCDECKHWTRKEYDYGRCDALPSARFEVGISAGWNGGVVDYIETQEDFFCAEFTPEEEKE